MKKEMDLNKTQNDAEKKTDFSKAESYKKCKKFIKNVKKCSKNAFYGKNFKIRVEKSPYDEYDKTSVLGEYNCMRIWVKTLLSIYGSIPNIIKLIDGLISSNATNPFGFGGTSFNTYGQIEKVIDLCERKNKMLNINILIEKLIEDCCEADRRLIDDRFVEKMTVEAISLELKCTPRSVFRRVNSLIDRLATYAIGKGWTTCFIESQLQDEPWVVEQFNSYRQEEIKKHRKD